MKNKYEAHQSKGTWLFLIIVMAIVDGLLFSLHMSDFIIMLLEWVILACLILYVGIFVFVLKKPLLMIDFNRKTIFMRNPSLFKKKKTVEVPFTEISDISMFGIGKFMVQFTIKTKNPIEKNGMTDSRKEGNALTANLYYLTLDSFKELNSVYSRLKSELDIK